MLVPLLPRLDRPAGPVTLPEHRAWAGGLAFTCHGARVGVRVTAAHVLDLLPAYLPPGWRPAASPGVDNLYSLVVGDASAESRLRRHHLLYAGAARLARSTELAHVLDALAADLHTVVAVAAPRRLFVRAGVVAWRGRSVVVVGRPGSGTSALVAALVRAGAAYASDTYAVFDARGRVHPYATPLRLRGAGGEAWTAVRRDAAALGGATVRAALPLGLVVAAEYRPGARWRPRVRPSGPALLALVAHAPLACLRPDFALRTLARAADGVPLLAGPRGEADDAAGLVLDHLQRTVPTPAESGPPDRESIPRHALTTVGWTPT
jgi:hypothetical protein